MSTERVRLRPGDSTILPKIIEGISPEVTLTEQSNGVLLTVTTKSGSKSVLIPKGEQGIQGPQGIQGIQGIQGPAGDDYQLTEEDVEAIKAAYDDIKEAAEDAAEAAAGSAEDAAGYAETAAEKEELATAASEAAANYEDSASDHAADALTYAGNASTSADQAAISAEGAVASASDAADSATAAAGSASNASDSATAASGSATAAAADALKAEGFAVGKQNGQDVGSDSTYYHNNAKYYKDQADAVLTSVQDEGAAQIAAIDAKGDEVLESIPSDYSELSDDVDSLKSAIDSKAPVIVATASGGIASFDDGADGMPVKALTVAVEPVQDLHGQDAPYPPGGGVNKFPITLTTLTKNGTTFTVADDGAVTISGTPTTQTRVALNSLSIMPDANMVFSVTGSATGIRVFTRANNSGTITYPTISPSANIVTGVTYDQFYLEVNTTFAGTATTLKFQLETGSTATEWSPYSNICPISGHTGATVYRTGKNLWDFANSRYCTFPFKKGMTIYVRQNTNVSSFSLYAQTAEQVGTSASDNLKTLVANNTYSITLEKDYARLCVSADAYGNITSGYVQITFDNVSGMIPFVDADTYPITFPTEAGTVYGGSLTVNEDGTGQLVVDRAIATVPQSATGVYVLTNTVRFYVANMLYRDWYKDSSKIRSNMLTYKGYNTDAPSFSHGDNSATVYFKLPLTLGLTTSGQIAEWLGNNPIQLSYPLATPLTYSLTATQITTLLGSNRIWADTGSISVDYCADTKSYVDDAIPAVPVQDVRSEGTSILQNGVANLPIATKHVLGLLKIDNFYGLQTFSGGTLALLPATDSEIKTGSSGYKSIPTSKQHQAVFYGLAAASGDTTQKSSSNAFGSYTESAKSAISTMLNGSVSVSGTTPSITALPGVRYVCGECATLDVTVPASGIIDVVFESGSTATVLTVTPPTGMTMKWIGEDPVNLEANKTYEINIKDGCLGMVVSWT